VKYFLRLIRKRKQPTQQPAQNKSLQAGTVTTTNSQAGQQNLHQPNDARFPAEGTQLAADQQLQQCQATPTTVSTMESAVPPSRLYLASAQTIADAANNAFRSGWLVVICCVSAVLLPLGLLARLVEAAFLFF
jgi:hypothetical protein